MSDFKAKMHQIQFWLGLCPQTLLGELTAHPSPSWIKGPNSEGREVCLPHSKFLDPPLHWKLCNGYVFSFHMFLLLKLGGCNLSMLWATKNVQLCFRLYCIRIMIPITQKSRVFLVHGLSVPKVLWKFIYYLLSNPERETEKWARTLKLWLHLYEAISQECYKKGV